MAKIFKDYFENTVESLHIECSCKVDIDKEPVFNPIKNFSKHPSILKIKKNTNFSACFSFHIVRKEDLLYQLNCLDPTKATQQTGIPTNIIEKNYDIFSEFLFANFNDITPTSLFPEQVKYVDVKPVFKKGSLNDKRNYRALSILSNISKIYERLLCKQLETYFEYLLSWCQCEFRKGFSVLTTLFSMIEKSNESLDSVGNFGALLTDLSNAFNCLPHDLPMPSLKLLYPYLTKKRQRAKINNSYSSWSKTRFGVSQGSILEPLLFNIFLCDLFFLYTTLVLQTILMIIFLVPLINILRLY